MFCRGPWWAINVVWPNQQTLLVEGDASPASPMVEPPLQGCASGVPIVRVALCKRPPISYVYFATVYSSNSVACRGGCGRCDGPGHPPWGASKGPVFFKNVGK